MGSLLGWLVGLDNRSPRPQQGVAEVVDPDPIPSFLAQSVIHVVESMSLLLVSALANDLAGTAQHHLIAVMCSLPPLELGLKGHIDI